MQFIMGGRLFQTEDLPQSINEAFLSLHSAFLSNGICNLNDFEKVAHQFFNDPQTHVQSHDKFFNNFTIIWQQFLNNGQYDKAEEIWNLALDIALRWEHQNPGKLIHKGTPFYFWGMTAILKGDLDKGYVLMHRALEEDVRTHRNQFPDTPGFAFATLNATRVDHKKNRDSDHLNTPNKSLPSGWKSQAFPENCAPNVP